VAFELNFKVDRRGTSLAIGYDEAFAPYGPGQLLRAGVLRRYCEDAAVDLYDFMPGGAGHKGDWATIVEPYAKIYVYRRGLRARTLYMGQRIGSAVKHGGLWRRVGERSRKELERFVSRVAPRRLHRAHLSVNGHPIDVEVAASDRDVAKGLAFR